MGTDETPRQKKVAAAIQRELASMLQNAIRNQGMSNLVLSITKVSVTIDLSLAKVYLSIFPQNKAGTYLKGVQDNAFHIRLDMAKRINHVCSFKNRMALFFFKKWADRHQSN
jgi:ribosome-binding factor A